MAEETNDKLTVHVTVQVKASTLQSIVSHAKQLVGKDARGVYRVDTADQLSEMITRFLEARDFDAYVRDARNYRLPRT